MAKFKKGDRVRNTRINDAEIPFGAIGTVDEDRSHAPWVRWDAGDINCQNEIHLELLTESSSPTPEMGPVEGTMEHWRWEKSVAVLAGMLSNPERSGNPEDYAKDTVRFIDCLIAELKKGGKS